MDWKLQIAHVKLGRTVKYFSKLYEKNFSICIKDEAITHFDIFVVPLYKNP